MLCFSTIDKQKTKNLILNVNHIEKQYSIPDQLAYISEIAELIQSMNDNKHVTISIKCFSI